VTPGFSANDSADLCLRDAEGEGEVDLSLAGCVAAADLADIIGPEPRPTVLLAGEQAGVDPGSVAFTTRQAVGQTARPMGVSAGHMFRSNSCPVRVAPRSVCRKYLPPLRPAIGLIVSGCPKPDVRRIAARRVVAGMAGKQLGWYRAVHEFPSDPMGGNGAAFEPILPVASPVTAGQPWPALIGSTPVDLGPESFGVTGAFPGISAHLRAVAHRRASSRLGAQHARVHATLRVHRVPPVLGAMPPVVDATRGLYRAFIIPGQGGR
jgi:hypothetical protein